MHAEAAMFKAMAEPTRLRLLVMLAEYGEACVGVLAEALGTLQTNVSRHLAVLRAAGLVQARRQGTWIHYRLAESRDRVVRRLQALLRECLASHPTAKADLLRLARALRQGATQLAPRARMVRRGGEA